MEVVEGGWGADLREKVIGCLTVLWQCMEISETCYDEDGSSVGMIS